MALILLLLLLADRGLAFELGVAHHFGSLQVTKTQSERLQDIATLRQRFTWVRDGLVWYGPGGPNLQRDFVRDYQSAQVNVLALFAYGDPNHPLGRFYFDYSSLPKLREWFVRLVRAHPGVDTWEVLNEMNLREYFHSPENPVQVYKALLKALYRNKPPHIKIVTGGLTLEGDVQSWLQGLCDREAAMNYDVLALHPYSWPKPLSQATFVNGRNFREWILWIRDCFHKQKLEPKPIWITEIGWPNKPDPSEKDRARGIISSAQLMDRLQDAIEISRELGIKKLFLYSLFDDADLTDEQVLPFGIHNHEGVSKLPKTIRPLLKESDPQ